jgi:hypothetical protein
VAGWWTPWWSGIGGRRFAGDAVSLVTQRSLAVAAVGVGVGGVYLGVVERTIVSG